MSERPTVDEFDAATGQTIVRPMTDEEYAAWITPTGNRPSLLTTINE